MNIFEFMCSLFSGFMGVVFAGVVIWFFQQKYSENSKRIEIFANRLRKEEDEFYDQIKKAKNGFYKLCKIIYNDSKQLNIPLVKSIVDDLQKAIDMTKINAVVLDKYCKLADEILKE